MNLFNNYKCDGQMSIEDYMPTKGMTQCERIVDYCRRFGSITTIEAFTDLGITRLASRIHDLTKEGYTIERTPVTGRNRYGETVHYTRYTVKEAGHVKES